MIAVDVAVSDRLHRVGFSMTDWRAIGADGSVVRQLTADGPLGSIRAASPIRAGAF